MAAARRLPRPAALPAHAFDVYLHTIDVVPGAGSGPEALDPYSPSIRQLYAAFLLDGEINNGGFSQLFFNGLGDWLDEAIAGLAAVGLEDHRQVMVDAADAALSKLDDLHAAQRDKSLEAYAEWAGESELQPYDDRWYGLPAIDAAFDRFLVGHADEIWEPA